MCQAVPWLSQDIPGKNKASRNARNSSTEQPRSQTAEPDLRRPLRALRSLTRNKCAKRLCGSEYCLA